MIPKTIKIAILGVVIILAIMAAYLGAFYIIVHSGRGTVLNIGLIDEKQLDSFNGDYVNLTLTNLSLYPTLWKSIQTLIDPSSNLNRISVSISTDEGRRITDEILRTPDNSFYNYIVYNEYVFKIWFVTP